ncbi:MAG: putative Glycosyl transferase related to UDP-glucuronosyltransferase-like protein [Rhodocyclales bacterium]|nr:putative Glycosyl transferase related to UDP-glucuronosyltransferase-like protein [Rhodocyclales bacterium]
MSSLERGARRFLFALELGGNLGHLARCLPLARMLQAQGHEILFAVPDSRTAGQMLAQHGIAFVESPRITVLSRSARSPINYADMLLREGYRDSAALQGAVQSWLNLFHLFQPDTVIADHAPTALLAARIDQLSAVALGSGFEIPPQSTPLPSMRPWDEVSTEQLVVADDGLLRAINTVLKAHRQSSMQTATDLFGSVLRILATFPELDHYGTRLGEYYAGVFYEFETAKDAPSVAWPEGSGARVLVYMRPEMRCFAPLLKALQASNYRVIFAAPGTHSSHAARFSAPHLHFSHRAIAFGPLLPEADLAIGYGSIGFTTQALRAGLPQLISPAFVEQQLCARRVVEMGAGLLLNARCDETQCGEAVERILNDSTCGKRAKGFAATYRNYDVNVGRIVGRVLRHENGRSETPDKVCKEI